MSLRSEKAEHSENTTICYWRYECDLGASNRTSVVFWSAHDRYKSPRRRKFKLPINECCVANRLCRFLLAFQKAAVPQYPLPPPMLSFEVLAQFIRQDPWLKHQTSPSPRPATDSPAHHAAPPTVQKLTVSAPATTVGHCAVSPTKSVTRRFQGSSASTASALLAAGKSRSTRRSQV